MGGIYRLNGRRKTARRGSQLDPRSLLVLVMATSFGALIGSFVIDGNSSLPRVHSYGGGGKQSSSTVRVRSAQGCDPNYDPCVPIASDVDCAGGKGNGPAYIYGRVTVIGADIYGLDRDGDGIACEPK